MQTPKLQKLIKSIRHSGMLGIYYVKGYTYMMDDFGDLIQVSFEQLGQASAYIHEAHNPH